MYRKCIYNRAAFGVKCRYGTVFRDRHFGLLGGHRRYQTQPGGEAADTARPRSIHAALRKGGDGRAGRERVFRRRGRQLRAACEQGARLDGRELSVAAGRGHAAAQGDRGKEERARLFPRVVRQRQLCVRSVCGHLSDPQQRRVDRDDKRGDLFASDKGGQQVKGHTLALSRLRRGFARRACRRHVQTRRSRRGDRA